MSHLTITESLDSIPPYKYKKQRQYLTLQIQNTKSKYSLTLQIKKLKTIAYLSNT